MLNDKKILITGGTGSWGQELITQILQRYKPKKILIYSRGEHKQVEMRRLFRNNPVISFIIGDVRDFKRLDTACIGVDYIFHLAALKHVPVCEENPWESVLTNINGAQNVIDAAIKNEVKCVVDISTDKAVDPLNVYGTCKSVGEKLMIAANLNQSDTKFVCVRGGNVLGTNGSVIPLFREQIRLQNKITITSYEMTRFFISLKQAINLVFKATQAAEGGEIFVINMPAMNIKDLAEVIVEELGDDKTEYVEIGVRPGEKIHEALVSKHEAKLSYVDEDYYIILSPILLDKLSSSYEKKGLKKFELGEFVSNSNETLSKDEIKTLLKKEGWLNPLLEDGVIKNMMNLRENDVGSPFEIEGWIKK